jgi:uncharacterized protein YaiE (UPF0345 family)
LLRALRAQLNIIKDQMTVVSGKLMVMLPGSDEWKEYGAGETFTVEANTKFQVKADQQVAYLCLYK